MGDKTTKASTLKVKVKATGAAAAAILKSPAVKKAAK